ncbi:hypothetical protein NMG60_11029630 [Bertholletia excelsa]
MYYVLKLQINLAFHPFFSLGITLNYWSIPLLQRRSIASSSRRFFTLQSNTDSHHGSSALIATISSEVGLQRPATTMPVSSNGQRLGQALLTAIPAGLSL